MLLAIRNDTPDLINEVGEVGRISGVESINGGAEMILAKHSRYDEYLKIRSDSLQLVILIPESLLPTRLGTLLRRSGVFRAIVPILTT